MRIVLLLALTGFVFAAHAAAFVPPGQQRMLSLFQPLGEPYDPGVWAPAPAAVVSHTTLRHLEGMDEPYDGKGGLFHTAELMRRFPNSALVLALYVGAGALEQIVRGELDGQIDRLARMLDGYRRPVYIRFGYEFEGPWSKLDPPTFVTAWKYFRARMRAAGSGQFAMVWHAAAQCIYTHNHQLVEAWYPGDDQVDWFGISYHRTNECGGMVAEGFVSLARHRGKPVMIAEASPKGFDLSGNRFSVDGRQFWPRDPDAIWNDYFTRYLRFVERNRDVVRMISYFNEHLDRYPLWGFPYAQGYWGDSRLEASPSLLARWRQVVLAPPYRVAGPRLFEDLGYVAPAR